MRKVPLYAENVFNKEADFANRQAENNQTKSTSIDIGRKKVELREIPVVTQGATFQSTTSKPWTMW